ncbi:MAG: family 78 glycoside hydrolase catalytic domain [Nocardioides sp.]|nr:family 78 glycoside hydrolase catalytic domain [Nocardioides sp.]
MSVLRLRVVRSVFVSLVLTAGVAIAPVALSASPASAAEDQLTVVDLTTNGREDPLGIPGSAPSLSWSSESEARGVVQSAYEVRIASSAETLESADVWDSGKVDSDRQVDVPYDGPALDSQTSYHWQVRIWDGDDQASGWSEPATFETGMLTADDWGDADWIGEPAGTEVNRWTDYTAEFDFTIDNLVFAPLVRTANLNNGYMWQLSVADGTPRFRPHTKINGNFELIESKDISSVISAEELATGEHTMAVTFEGSTITTKLDGQVIDTRQDPTFDKGFVGFRSSEATEGTEAATVHAVRVTAKTGDMLLDTDFTSGNPFTGGTVVEDGLEVKGNLETLWRSPDENRPLLRKDFETAGGKSITRARVYASARGIYALNINGEEVGDQHLAPGFTDYTTRIQSQSYDVTDLLTDGANSFGAELADGWWAGKVGMWGPGVYGDDLSLIARLRIDYSDGTSDWVDTDESWTTHAGPYVFTDNIDGETYDANHAQPGWSQPGFDDGNWNPVAVAETATDLLVPQPDEPVRTTEELESVERTEPSPGTFIYDLDQNMVGVARMTLQGKAGDTVTFRYGEVLNPDGSLYTANLRAAKVTDHYTFGADGTITYEPKFTQHGFRYVEITGAATPPTVEDVTGVVWGSDLPVTGDLETSSPMLNQLVSNISWGQRGNFLSIPTDTPARDERLGWSGDINVFAPTASYLADTRAFLSKWMQDMSDAQFDNGDLPGIAPEPPVGCCGSGTGWSDAGITVPYALWSSYGDASTARQFYPEMSAFMDYVRDHAGADLIDEGRGGWGDWLNLDDPTPTSVMGTAYLAEDARMMSEMASAIGKDADAAEYATLSDDVRAAFVDEFVSADGTVSGNSQTAYAMALGMDLVPDAQREAVGAKFVAKLDGSDNHLTTGFLGTPWLLPALSSIDRDDLAYTMLMHEDYPSWGYEVAKGATTMWERWNSIMPDGSFGDAGMNSFNHYAYGAVGDWMYQNIGGIAAAEPGYKKSRIEPSMNGPLTHGGGELDTVFGTIATDWDSSGDDLTLSVDVPVNTTADVVLPADNAWSVTEGGSFLTDVEAVQDVVSKDGRVTATVGSGHYEFAVTEGNRLLGSIIDDLAALRTHVDEVEEAGDLVIADADHIDASLETASDHVISALTALLDDDSAASQTELQAALTEVRDLRAWLDESDVDGPVKGDIDRRLAGIETRLVAAVTSNMGISVALPPVAGEVLPGETVAGTIEVANTGESDLSDLAATVAVDGWDEQAASVARVPAGESVQLPVEFTVPKNAVPGAHDAALEATFTSDGETFTVNDETSGWATVASGVEIGDVTATTAETDPPEHTVVDVPITNNSATDVRGHAVVELPGGLRPVSSDDTLVPSGETVDVKVPAVLPLDVVGGAVEATVEFRRPGAVLASATAMPSFDLVAPPTAETIDHVDFGDAPSEDAHGIQASESSGTSTEAGYTRRYSHSNFPGSWYSVELDVPAGKPFILRNIETYDGAHTKKYEIYVDDVLVKSQTVARAEGGEGIKVYDALIDDASLLANDGKVRVRFEYPEGASGFYDPSIADTWVLAVPEDTQVPDVSAYVSSGTSGDHGWFRSEAQVSVEAADNRDTNPVVETGESAGWQDYVGPVSISGEGRHELSFRAKDTNGNRSEPKSVPVWIDATAPTTEVTVTQKPGVEGSDRARVSFAAADALSGVEHTAFRVDGGQWQVESGKPVTVEGYGEHVVDYASTDVAGNAEVMRRTTVTLADVESIAAVVAPQVNGSVRFGSLLRSTPGSWNTKGLRFNRQWLRNGRRIAGAKGVRYRLRRADVGKRISLRVRATKPGKRAGVAVSDPTGRVARAKSSVKVTVNRTKVRVGRPVVLWARVTATGIKPGGRVAFLVDGRVVRRVRFGHGHAVTRLRLAVGRHKVRARYLGTTTVARSLSPIVRVRVKR